jgi:hypothetical protein
MASCASPTWSWLSPRAIGLAIPSGSAPLRAQAPQSETRAAPTAPPAAARPAMDDIVKTIERLAKLRQKNTLTEEEFASKKAELLSRL